MKIDPNAPAFPNIRDAKQEPGRTNFEGPLGLTVRAEIASRCLAGIMANSHLSEVPKQAMAEMSVSHADALIAELNKEKE